MDGRLAVEKGAQVNIKKQLFGLGGVIELKEGFKPIKLPGEPVGSVYLESEKTLENMQLFVSKQTALEEVIDISAAVPPVEDGEYNYGLYTKSGKVFVYPMKLEMDGKTYAVWADLINAINKAKNVRLSALNRGKPIPWTLKKNRFSLNNENAVLDNCTIK